ncbi:MAG: glycine cleavage system aminomethyltransferase GcvT [Planctomycetes bacterium]|nr:glycine cleavage system aminomethyltransferase GcvT [Planctomycetota bacterium]
MKKTVLNSVHRDLGARLVEFGGFEMPVQYASIVEEHLAVRRGAGLFDLCHMGRFEIRGRDAVRAVDAIVTNDVARMDSGQIRYALVLNEQGGVRDDVLVYRMPDSVLLVVNAGNREKLLPWFREHLRAHAVEFRDRSEEIAMIAVQGPGAEDLLAPLVTTSWVPALRKLGYYRMSDAKVGVGGKVYDGWVSRTGYTGEDGFELYVPSAEACTLWSALEEHAGQKLRPCGLGARDTLRLEAAMPLYGHELDETANPLEAGLEFGIKLEKPNGFIGCEALRRSKEAGLQRKLAGFRVDGKRVARQGMPVFAGGKEVGIVTSGAPSPTLGANIALAYVERGLSESAALEVDVRGTRAALAWTPLPFYSRKRG